MYSSTDNANDADVELSIDNDGDGTTDEVLKAGKNTETVYEPPEIDGPDEIIETEESDSDSLPLILIIIGAIVLLIVVVIIIVVASKSKKKKPEDDAETPTVYPEDYPEAETPVVAEAPARDANTGSITILTGSMEGTSIPIQDGEMVTLGKDKKLARLAFSGDYNHVSRVHCTVTFSARHRKYYVTDCSSNGTYRENRARLEKGKRTAVEPNSVILLADERCSVRLK
jgi:hypothetical protein